jgi:hypothetical protein
LVVFDHVHILVFFPSKPASIHELLINTAISLEFSESAAQVWSGMQLGDFLRVNIFEPLVNVLNDMHAKIKLSRFSRFKGMKDTGFHVSPDQAHRLSCCYVTNPQVVLFFLCY